MNADRKPAYAISATCKFRASVDAWVCDHCGTRVPLSLSRNVPIGQCLPTRPPQIITAPPPPLEPPTREPVGTELKRLLGRIGITAVDGCKCNARAKTLDIWGADKTEERIDEVVGWLREEATRRRLPFFDAVGRLLVRRAIASARRKSALTK